jgi:hypothetical protein
LRHIRLTPAQAEHITATLTALADDTEEAAQDQPRYGLLLGLYQQPGPIGQPPAAATTEDAS